MENEKRDEELWRMAKRRTCFKQAFAAYLCVNAFLIGVWYFTSGVDSYFWPKWAILGWGLGLAIQYFESYHGNAIFSAEKEYQRLSQNRKP